ncbi:hypothetical protein IG193_05880 [Infirmifilum lucidum]|uniref:Uncharacterized protein n=1 Tax=Infirmifilum lucidum TaxID=2776706 RepID=A0A7L9FHP5_9CREN|nr:hypothetical protein [Infirmifilum lucidum]QOJ78295.1 hypothetical protein IG193_05880 [Infirmifilum lucidum]
MAEIVLGVMDFIALIIGFIALVVLIVIIAIEYHYWRRRRELKRIIVRGGSH